VRTLGLDQAVFPATLGLDQAVFLAEDRGHTTPARRSSERAAAVVDADERIRLYVLSKSGKVVLVRFREMSLLAPI
jgi:hypothetical protein